MSLGPDGERAGTTDDTIRRLRFELADALAARGRTRYREAISEFDAALKEPGHWPTAAEIHFKVGELSRQQDPSAALRRYLLALEEPGLHDAVAPQALSLIDEMPEGELAVARLRPTDVERLTTLATTSRVTPVSLLAARIAHLRGDEENALRLLRPPAADDGPADGGVILQVALLLLELNRLDHALELVQSRVDQPEFKTVAMRAQLLKGDYAEVLALADRDGDEQPDATERTDLRALALTGLGRWSEAAALLQDRAEPALHAARVVVCLVGRLYDEAQTAATEFILAAPIDPSAIILDAQVKLESLGDHIPAGEDVSETASEHFETGRGLLEAATSRLQTPPEGLWWLQVQNALRGEEGRFGFFRMVLRGCAGDQLTVDELNGIDLSTTSYAQDAVIYERLADAVRLTAPATDAAQSFANASRAWQHKDVRDGRHAHQCALAAYELEPNEARAIELAFAMIYDSYRPQELQALASRIDDTVALALTWIPRSTSGSLAELSRAVAWLLGRQYEVAVRDKVRLAQQAIPWLVAASSLATEDDALDSLLASTLRTAGNHDAALYFAERATRATRDAFSVSTTIICLLDRAELLAVRHQIEDPALETVRSWTSAVELVCQLIAGEFPAGRQFDEQMLEETDWVRSYAAMHRGLESGLASARPLIDTALDLLDESDVEYNEILLAGIEGRPDLGGWLTRAAEAGNLTDRHLGMCTALVNWFDDPAVPFDTLADALLAVAPRPCDVEQFVNVDAPLLVAAREGHDLPRPVTTPANALAAARLRLEAEAAAWRDRLDDVTPGLSSLVEVTQATTSADLSAAGERALSAISNPEFQHVVSEVVAQATTTALGQVVGHQIEWRLGRRAPDPDGVAMVLRAGEEVPMSQRLAVLVLSEGDDPDTLHRLIESSTPEDLAEAVDVVVTAAAPVISDVDEFWQLFDSLAPVASTSGPPEDLRDRVRHSLTLLLSDLLELTSEQAEMRSPFSFVLGSAFVPEDTGPDWTLFQDLVPALKARVADQKGFSMPGCFVRGDYMAEDALWILTNGAPREAHRLPPHGWIVPCEPEAALCRDPLSGEPVGVSAADSRPEEAWTPLEFAMRWVERFVLDHTPDLVSVLDIAMLLDDDDPDSGRLLSDPRQFVAALDRVRAMLADGSSREPSDLTAALSRLAQRQSTRLEPVS